MLAGLNLLGGALPGALEQILPYLICQLPSAAAESRPREAAKKLAVEQLFNGISGFAVVAYLPRLA